jgi:hypothetical protein
MKLFAISYCAPPQPTAQAIQVACLLHHLDARVTLLHGRDVQCTGGGRQQSDFFARVAVLPVHDPGPRLGPLAQRAAVRWLPLYLSCPDRFGRWRRRALGPALASIGAARPDALVSFGMPMSSHLLALALKRRTGLPWLAHFSVPWSDSPFHRSSWLEHQFNLAMERRVVEAADGLLFTSSRTRELVMRKYPAARLGVAGVLPQASGMAPVPAGARLPAPQERRPEHVARAFRQFVQEAIARSRVRP